MNLFDDNYPYKIKLLGYSASGLSNGMTRTSLYLKSHENIYTLLHMSSVFNEIITIKKGYDIKEIKGSYIIGDFDEELNFEKIKVSKILGNEKISKSAQIIILTRFSKSDTILLSNSIALDLEKNKLFILSEKASPINSDILIAKLHDNRIK